MFLLLFWECLHLLRSQHVVPEHQQKLFLNSHFKASIIQAKPMAAKSNIFAGKLDSYLKRHASFNLNFLLYAPFYGQGSTTSRLHRHYEETVYCWKNILTFSGNFLFVITTIIITITIIIIIVIFVITVYHYNWLVSLFHWH